MTDLVRARKALVTTMLARVIKGVQDNEDIPLPAFGAATEAQWWTTWWRLQKR